jgi:hypothetical protein
MKTAALENYKVPTGEQIAKKMAQTYWARFYELHSQKTKWTKEEKTEFERLKGMLKMIGGRI